MPQAGNWARDERIEIRIVLYMPLTGSWSQPSKIGGQSRFISNFKKGRCTLVHALRYQGKIG